MSCSFFVWTFLKSLEGGNLKKSLLAVFLLIIMLLSSTLAAYAEGSGNVDGGGGGLNQGTKAYNWPGNSYQGVRVTVVDAESGGVVADPMDFTNKNLSSVAGNMFSFGKVSKMQYRNGAALTANTSIRQKIPIATSMYPSPLRFRHTSLILLFMAAPPKAFPILFRVFDNP